LQNHSNNYELSENAIKMTFCLISRHEGINNGCARRNGQVASTIPNYISIHIILCVCTTSGESKASAPTKRTGLVFVRFFFCWLLAFAGLIITDTIHTKYLLFSGVRYQLRLSRKQKNEQCILHRQEGK
jgi:small basic protein